MPPTPHPHAPPTPHPHAPHASPPACCPQLLADMERCARALARSVGYVGAATVEFLYIMETQQYCFLELNPRLQVRGAVRCGPVRWWAGG